MCGGGLSDWTYRLTIDDNVLFLEDLAKKTFHSLFDHPYLAFWKKMHEKFGVKVHFNIHGSSRGFYISQVPEVYRSEWVANSDWIRLTFHSMRCVEEHFKYKYSGYDEVKSDYLELTNHIKRFAGEELISPFTTIHGAAMSKDGCRALRDCGVRGLGGASWRNYSPGIIKIYYNYYLSMEQGIEVDLKGIWKDPELNLYFTSFDVILHDLEKEEIPKIAQFVIKNRYHWHHMEVTFEEWAINPSSPSFQPDAEEKVEIVLSWLTRHGIKPVFLEEIL